MQNGKILLKRVAMNRGAVYTDYCSLNYNGVVFNSKEALLNLANELKEHSDEELELLSAFLMQWCNDNACIEAQTSGSTGKPKLIRIEKSAMLASAERTIKFLNLQAGDSALLCLSVKYIAGKMMVVRAMLGGLNLIQGSVKSNPLMEVGDKIDFAAMVPLQVASILNENSDLLTKVDKLIIGGGAIDATLAGKIADMDLQAWETYGMTETVSHIALRKVTKNELPFRLLPQVHVVKDERNCLVVLPSSINKDQLTTNDVIELVAEDEFMLKGRYDNVINTGGIKIYPEEVERQLEEFISRTFIVSSLPDTMLGQRIVLVIEGDEDDTIDWEQIFGHLKPFEKPKEVRFVKKFPLTGTGKILRLKIQQQL